MKLKIEPQKLSSKNSAANKKISKYYIQ